MKNARTCVAALSLTVVPCLAAAPAVAAPPAAPVSPTLHLGDPGLPETRTTQDIARGVTLTHIMRGTEPAAPEAINTTAKGPWNAWVLTIDPRGAQGQLVATDGPDMAKVETTDVLSAYAGGVAAVNASFFTFTASKDYPGDPVGLYVKNGQLLSEPTKDPREYDLVFNSKQNKLDITKTTWTGSLTTKRAHNKQANKKTTLEEINHPPVVPAACAALPDQRACTVDGETVLFTRDFAATTPAGPGFEAVLDKHDCVVRSADTRGTALAEGERSVQATGSDIVALKAVAQGCLTVSSTLLDDGGKPIKTNKFTYAVNGRVLLMKGGQIVAQDVPGDAFFARNPRTLAGTTAGGVIKLIVIDGRRATSVGTTIAETAQVAKDLGLTEALNLDGGGSSTMVANGKVVNTVSGSAVRAVGDALVWVPGRNN